MAEDRSGRITATHHADSRAAAEFFVLARAIFHETALLVGIFSSSERKLPYRAFRAQAASVTLGLSGPSRRWSYVAGFGNCRSLHP